MRTVFISLKMHLREVFQENGKDSSAVVRRIKYFTILLKSYVAQLTLEHFEINARSSASCAADTTLFYAFL